MQGGSVSDELDLTETSAETATRCAQCGCALPVPADVMTIVCASDGEIIPTCSVSCMAGLVADLAGRTREPAAGRRN